MAPKIGCWCGSRSGTEPEPDSSRKRLGNSTQQSNPSITGRYSWRTTGSLDRRAALADADQLHVEPGAVTALRDAFADALAKVDRQIELAGKDLRVSGWANDPVSTQATAAFNHHS